MKKKTRKITVWQVTSTTYWTRDDGDEFDFGEVTENVVADSFDQAIKKVREAACIGEVVDADPDVEGDLSGKVTRIEFSDAHWLCDATL